MNGEYQYPTMVNIVAVATVAEDLGTEAELSGGTQALWTLASLIRKFLVSSATQLSVKPKIINPAPYEQCLEYIIVSKSGTATRISVSDCKMYIQGDLERLHLFSDWLDFPEDTPAGYHLHYDPLVGAEWVHPESIDLVIRVDSR